MQDTDLLLSLAEIAGIFVGFAALISIRSAAAADARSLGGDDCDLGGDRRPGAGHRQ